MPGRAVKVGVPGNLQPLLRTQSVNGTVHLLAHAPLESIRAMVREIDGGQIYLFDISASNKSGQNHSIQVFVQQAGEPDHLNDSDAVASSISYVTLTRFAAR